MTGQAVAGIVAAAVIGGGSLVTAATGTDTDTDTSAPTTNLTVPCGAVWERLPEDLQGDLRALKDLSPAERPAAVRQLREDALAGGYGSQVQQFAERRDERRAWVRRHLPDQVRQDLKAALQADDEERRAALQEVRDAALAGEYGDRVQQAAERRQERRDACRPGETG